MRMLLDKIKAMKDLISVIVNHVNEILVGATAIAARQLELFFIKRKKKRIGKREEGENLQDKG